MNEHGSDLVLSPLQRGRRVGLDKSVHDELTWRLDKRRLRQLGSATDGGSGNNDGGGRQPTVIFEVRSSLVFSLGGSGSHPAVGEQTNQVRPAWGLVIIVLCYKRVVFVNNIRFLSAAPHCVGITFATGKLIVNPAFIRWPPGTLAQ